MVVKIERDLAKLAASYGRTVERTGKGHYRLVAEGLPPVFCAATSSDRKRWQRNVERDLKAKKNPPPETGAG